MKYYAHLPNMTAPSQKTDKLESGLMIVRCAGASSVINILKDGRWGRAPETYGECPVLTADVAVAFNKVCAAQLFWLVSASWVNPPCFIVTEWIQHCKTLDTTVLAGE